MFLLLKYSIKGFVAKSIIRRCRQPLVKELVQPIRSLGKYRNIYFGGSSQAIFSGNNMNSILDKNNSTSLTVAENIKSKFIIPILGICIAGAAAYAVTQHVDFNSLIQSATTKVAELGPFGYVYFSGIYILAEILAIPVVGLTASSGYLFGLLPGFLVVISSATIAACISFFIGRTFLRSWAVKIASGSPKWKAIDKAISKEGFKVILLLRLSPLLPFAISNYLYGATSVDFWSFFYATFLGFSPGSLGIVYFGSAGKAIFGESGVGASLPWYAYLGFGAVLILLVQTIAKIATDAIKDVEFSETDQSKPID